MFIEIWRRRREGRWAWRMKKKRELYRGGRGTGMRKRIGEMRRTRKKRKGGELGVRRALRNGGEPGEMGAE
jgi:hypothetical protein